MIAYFWEKTQIWDKFPSHEGLFWGKKESQFKMNGGCVMQKVNFKGKCIKGQLGK